MDKMDILTHTASEAAVLLLLVDVTKLLRQIIRAQEGFEKGKKENLCHQNVENTVSATPLRDFF